MAELLAGKRVLVTGVGPGLGTEIVRQLASHGADVMMVARSDRVVPKLVEDIAQQGRRALSVRASITESAGRDEVAAAVAEHFDGGLDVLVNSAFHAGEIAPFADADLERWARPMNVNYFGTLALTQRLLPALRVAASERGDARVVMINTMSIHRLEPGHGAYAGSKAALGAVTKTLAEELGPAGIRVNAVHPGYIFGDSVKTYFEWQATERGEGATWEDIYRERADETALRYLPEPREIAGAVVFFASDLSKCVTGTALPVNAGHWMPPSA